VYLRLLGSRLPARKRSLSRGAEVSRAAPAGYRDSTSVASPRQAQGVG